MQVLIRWALQRGTSCLPKSANPGRIASNFDVIDWQLQPEDQQALDSLPYRVSTVGLTDWHMLAYAYMVDPGRENRWFGCQCLSNGMHALVLKPLTATKYLCINAKRTESNNQRGCCSRYSPPRCGCLVCLLLLPLQQRMVSGVMWLSPKGPYRTLQELWDEEEEQACAV
jgi:hypothetical protein